MFKENSLTSKPITAETSKRITALRFLLIVFVVFIHNNFTQEQIIEDAIKSGAEPFVYNNNLTGRWIQLFIAEGVARCAVPLFFLFASFLQFMKNDSYFALLKKKARTLLLPFLLWPVLNIAFYTGLRLFAQTFFPGMLKTPGVFIFSGWTAEDWLHAFFGYGDMTDGRTHGGFVYQFWFLRDLLICIVFSPLLRLAVRKIPFCFFIAVSFCYFSNTRPFFVDVHAFFYYTLGIYWAEFDFDLFKFADKIKWKALVPLYLALWFATNRFYGKFSAAYWFMILLSGIIMLKTSLYIVKSEKLFSIAKYFAGFSFWLYAVHAPTLEQSLKAVWRRILPMTNTWLCMAEFFGVSLLIVVTGTLSGIVLKKICFPLFKILNGGR